MRLLVIIPDQLSSIIKKGELQPRYYNPGNLADEIHILMTNADKPPVEALKSMVGDARLFLHNQPELTALPAGGLLWFKRQRLKRWTERGLRLIRTIAPDMIRCHGADWNAYLAAEIKDTLGIPYCVSLHINPDINAVRRYLPPVNAAQQRSNAFYEMLEYRGLRTANKILPVYKPILPYLHRIGVTPERVEVCYNVLNITHLRQKTDYALHKPARLLYVGRLFEHKNPRHILKALTDLPDVHFTLVGDGPQRPILEAYARELGLERRVVFEPSVANDVLCRRLPEFDLFVIHSQYWELNKSVLEALLTGLPVVINRRDGEPVPEFSEGDFVRLVDNSPQAYQSALRELLANHAGREALGRRAFAHARTRWDPKITEAKYVAVYKELLGANHGA